MLINSFIQMENSIKQFTPLCMITKDRLHSRLNVFCLHHPLPRLICHKARLARLTLQQSCSLKALETLLHCEFLNELLNLFHFRMIFHNLYTKKPLQYELFFGDTSEQLLSGKIYHNKQSPSQNECSYEFLKCLDG